MDTPRDVLVGVDAGATKSVALAVAPAGERLGRAEGPGANPKRHGLDVAAAGIAALCRAAMPAGRLAAGRGPAPGLLLVAGAGIDRPAHARALAAALAALLPAADRIVVVNDTLAALRAATPDAVGLVVPVSTGGNVIGRAPDGRVTDRGHGIFGGGYVLGALAARAARRGDVDSALRDVIAEAHLDGAGRRPGPEVALLGAAVAAAAERGDPLPARMVDRWCGRVADAAAEEVVRLGLPGDVRVVVYGGLGEVSPWLAGRIRAAVRKGVPRARIVGLAVEPAEGAAALALDAWRGAPVAWDFVPRR
jgi:N-acetylglucosamine kinase-like BadF-type ATPase